MPARPRRPLVPRSEVTTSLPTYYSRLGPFRDLLAGGGGILTYHHVGSSPPGVRLKGLYVSPRLFTRQMDELRANGFVTETYDRSTSARNPETRRIFLTFDDGFRDVFEHALPVLRNSRFTAIQFLVADLLGQTSEWQAASGEVPGKLMDQAEVKDWIDAGNQIGSHTLRHPFLTRLAFAEAREEITASKKKLEDMFGVAIDHFCYPYGDWNREVRDLVKAAGYRSACTTEFGVNTPDTDPFALRRLTARYPSRNWRNFLRWLAGS